MRCELRDIERRRYETSTRDYDDRDQERNADSDLRTPADDEM